MAELQTARLDGEVVTVNGYYSPIDEPDDIGYRAQVLSMELPGRLIAERHSAAWVFGLLDSPPAIQQFCADAGARVRSPSSSRHQIREVVIDDAETLTIGDLRVTTPLRTAIDIARFTVDFGSEDRAIVAGLMRLGGFGLADCAATMERRRNLPGKHRALARIRQAEPRLACGGPPVW